MFMPSNLAEDFIRHRGSHHGGDIIRAVLGWHQANNITANHIHSFDSLHKPDCLINAKPSNTRFNI